MSDAERRLDQASQIALAQRLRLKSGVAATRSRLMPGRLVADGKRHVSDQAKALVSDSKAHVAAHPAITAAVAGGILAWVFRKPLLKYAPPLAQRGYDWLSGKLPFSQIVPETQQSAELEPDDAADDLDTTAVDDDLTEDDADQDPT